MFNPQEDGFTTTKWTYNEKVNELVLVTKQAKQPIETYSSFRKGVEIAPKISEDAVVIGAPLSVVPNTHGIMNIKGNVKSIPSGRSRS